MSIVFFHGITHVWPSLLENTPIFTYYTYEFFGNWKMEMFYLFFSTSLLESSVKRTFPTLTLVTVMVWIGNVFTGSCVVLNTWSPTGIIVWRGGGNFRRWGLRTWKHLPWRGPPPPSHDASSPRIHFLLLMLPHHRSRATDPRAVDWILWNPEIRYRILPAGCFPQAFCHRDEAVANLWYCY